MPPLIIEESTKVRPESLLQRIQSSSGSDGLVELRSVYPDSRFYWRDPWGLIVFWNSASGRRPRPSRSTNNLPEALMHGAGFVEDIISGTVLKDRAGNRESMARDMVEDLDVIRVMFE